MSEFNAQDLALNAQKQAGEVGRVAKKAGGKAARRAAKMVSKAIAKLLREAIKAITKFIVDALVAVFGWEVVLIVLAVLAFSIFLSAIPFGDWILGTKKASEADLMISAQYQETFVKLSEESIYMIDIEEASEEWKQTMKSIVQPSWAIPASFARYEMIRSSSSVNLPDAESMFEGLAPTFTYRTITDDTEYIKTVTVCYVEKPVKDSNGDVMLDEDGEEITQRVAQEPTYYYTERELPARDILTSVTIPFGSTEIKSVTKYYPGGTLTDEDQWEEGGYSYNSESDCGSTTYTKSVKTVVDDRGVPFTDFDTEAFKSYIISKGVKEKHLDEFFEYIVAADPNFPIELYSGVIVSGGEGYVPGSSNYVISGEMIDGWVWPIANTPMNVNSYFGPRWGRNHNGVDLGGKAYKNAPILAARDGIVIYVGWSDSYGNWAILGHEGNLQTRYAHMSSYSVKVGDQLTAGDQIGVQGTTGRSTGPHLHFEVIEADPNKPLVNTKNAPKIYDPMIFLGPIRDGG